MYFFIYCNWVSTRWQWSVDLYGAKIGETIHKTIKKQYKNTEFTE